MDFHVPPEIQAIKQTVHDFVEEELRPLEQQVECDGAPDDLRRHLTQRAVELGIYSLAMPREYGGRGIGLLGQVMVAEEMGRIHPALRFVVSDGDQIVLKWGTPEQRQKYLAPLVRGEIRTAISMTEPESGSDASAIQTCATRDRDGWIIQGGKIFTAHGNHAAYTKVFAVTEPGNKSAGVTCFIVPTDAPGFRIARVLDTIAPSLELCEIKLDQVRVGEDCVLGGVGNGMQVFGTTYASNRGRYGGFCVGIAEFLLERMRDHANARVVFGRPIADRQAIQWWIADTAIDIYATRMMTYNFAWRYDQGLDVRHESSMVKTFAVEMVGRAADRAIQMHGGMGLTKDLPFERIYREVRGLRIAGGTTEIQRIIIARNILRKNVPLGFGADADNKDEEL